MSEDLLLGRGVHSAKLHRQAFKSAWMRLQDEWEDLDESELARERLDRLVRDCRSLIEPPVDSEEEWEFWLNTASQKWGGWRFENAEDAAKSMPAWACEVDTDWALWQKLRVVDREDLSEHKRSFWRAVGACVNMGMKPGAERAIQECVLSCTAPSVRWEVGDEREASFQDYARFFQELLDIPPREITQEEIAVQIEHQLAIQVPDNLLDVCQAAACTALTQACAITPLQAQTAIKNRCGEDIEVKQVDLIRALRDWHAETSLFQVYKVPHPWDRVYEAATERA